MHIELESLLQLTIDNNASDLHISNEADVYIRQNGVLTSAHKTLTKNLKDNILKSIINSKQLSQLESNIEIDFSLKFKQSGYFRVHYYKSLGSLSATFRYIPLNIPTLENLNLLETYKKVTYKRNGLILITGPTGSGKSTTIASMLDHINQTQKKHIITLEDPIEYQYQNIKSIFSQRTVGVDTVSFQHGIKTALRQNPDIIVVGEIRDRDTMQAVLTAAQTGHLVFATLHTSSSVDTLNRILNLFDNSQKQHIQSILSASLISIMSQVLLPNIDNNLQLISEIMIPNNAIKNLIQEGKIEQIYSHMKLGQTNSGMTTQSEEINKLLLKEQISKEVAINYANQPSEIKNK